MIGAGMLARTLALMAPPELTVGVAGSKRSVTCAPASAEAANAQSAIKDAKTVLFENFIYGSLSSWPELQEDAEVLEIHAVIPIQVSRRVVVVLAGASAKRLPQGLEIRAINHAIGVDVTERDGAFRHGRTVRRADILQEQVGARKESFGVGPQGRIGQPHCLDKASLRGYGRNPRTEAGVGYGWNSRCDGGIGL